MKLGASLLFLGFALVACRQAAVRGDLPADETAAGSTAVASDPYEIHKQKFLDFYLQKNYDAALAEAAAALEAAPTRREAYMLVSKTFIDAGRDQDGISFFAALAERDPSRAEPWFFKGFHEGRRSLWEDARISLEKAATLAPEDAESHFRLGQVLERHGDLEGAERELRRAHAIDPGSAAKAASLMGVLSAAGKDDDAERIAAALLAGGPDSAEAVYAVATLRLRQKRWTEAETALRRALALAPEFTPARADLVRLLVQTGRKSEADEELARVGAAAGGPPRP